MKHLIAISVACSGVFFGSVAFAQQAQQVQVVEQEQLEQAQQQPPPQQQYVAQPPQVVVVAPPPETDGLRLRAGIVAAGGAEFISDFGVGMGGMEGRIGLQVNNLIGVYLQPSLTFGGGSIGNIPVFTGTFSVSAVVDFTLADRFFFGVGGGFGVLNNPWGPEILVRVGAYPVMGVGRNGYSRSGLVISADARMFVLFSGSQTLPVMQLLGCIGYEVF